MPPGATAAAAAAEKSRSYATLRQPFSFIPAAYESYGRPCDEISKFLATAADLTAKKILGAPFATQESPGFARVKNSLLGRWTKQISVSIQKSNAYMILNGRAAALGVVAGTYDFDFSDDFQEL